jgi:hypothetical protein
MMENRQSLINRLYPDHKIMGLPQMIVEGSGWYDTLITEPDDIMALARAGVDAAGRQIRMMALELESPDGIRRVADFRPEEIL